MENKFKEKLQYEAPRFEVIEIVSEGIICTSSQDTSGSDFVNGGTHGDDMTDIWE